ncbi:MAG: glycosyltransferase family 25 protein [Kiritimatiellae bacterium]|nr:glycosyltransferase family 25 protein [Kiritimatiellia bacterium]
MKAFVVNLDRSRDRMSEVDAELKRVGIEYERVSAVDGSNLSAAELNTDVCRFQMCRCMGRRLRLAEIGCALSNLKVHRTALAENLPRWAVFEDDVVVDAEAWRQAVETIEETDEPNVPTVWLLNDGHGVADPGTRKVVRLLGNQRGIMHTWGTLGYALNAAAARRILELAWPVRYCADAWSTYCRKGVEVRVVFPNAVREKPSSSQFSTVLSKTDHGRLWVWYGHFVKFRYVVCFWLDILVYRLCRLFAGRWR